MAAYIELQIKNLDDLFSSNGPQVEVLRRVENLGVKIFHILAIFLSCPITCVGVGVGVGGLPTNDAAQSNLIKRPLVLVLLLLLFLDLASEGFRLRLDLSRREEENLPEMQIVVRLFRMMMC